MPYRLIKCLLLFTGNQCNCGSFSVITAAGVNTKQQAAGGISFPPTADAMDKLLLFKDGSINYVQLELDISKVGDASDDSVHEGHKVVKS